MSNPRHLRNITVTLEEGVAEWARVEAARRDTSVSRLLGTMLKEHMSREQDDADHAVTKAAERLENFGKRHKLALGKTNIKDLINEGRR